MRFMDMNFSMTACSPAGARPARIGRAHTDLLRGRRGDGGVRRGGERGQVERRREERREEKGGEARPLGWEVAGRGGEV